MSKIVPESMTAETKQFEGYKGNGFHILST